MKSKSIEQLLSEFPKTRPPMSPAHHARHELDYKINRSASASLAGKAALWMEQWMHKKVAAGQGGNTLEVGAGTLNHLCFELLEDNYDVVEPLAFLYEEQIDEIAKVNTFYESLSQVPANKQYDRIISIATFEHMEDLPAELAIMHQLLAPDGQLQVGIPSEGGALWGLAWRLTTGISYRLRTGLEYKQLVRYEHINTAEDIIALIEHQFSDVKVERSFINHKHLSFYTFITASK